MVDWCMNIYHSPLEYLVEENAKNTESENYFF